MLELLAHLGDRGARLPALIVPGRDSAWAQTLRRAFEEWCDDRGIAPVIVDTGDISHLAGLETIREAVRGVFAEHPTVDTAVPLRTEPRCQRSASRRSSAGRSGTTC
jgi:DNA-binding LacI/PurR family transcriptional regulator